MPNKRFLVFICVFCLTSAFAQITDTVPDNNLSLYSYSSIHYKGSATIELPEQSYICQYNYVNVIDSFLYIQLNIGPIEAGRVLATPDTILFINKLQKNYYNGDYLFFRYLLDLEIDFFAIQAIFNGVYVYTPDEVELSYHGESIFDGFPFFNKLICEFEDYALKLDVKKATFNDAPKISATIPKNFSVIKF